MIVLRSIAVLLSHWRKHPFQLVTLLTGLFLASGLWTGVEAVNTEARASYALAEAALTPSRFSSIVSARTSTISIETDKRLQTSGWRTSPIFEKRIRLGDRRVRAIGVDVLTYPAREIFQDTASQNSTQDFLTSLIGNTGTLFANGDTAAFLKDSGVAGEIQTSRNLPPKTVLGDFSALARILPGKEADISAGGFSRLIVLKHQPRDQVPLSRFESVVLTEPADRTGTAELADSFHLNLTAFGFLSFVVGLFVVYGIIALSLEQRRVVFRTLRLLGVSRRQLLVSLSIELLVLATVGGTLGVIGGYYLAVLLLPDVAATMESLYGANISGSIAFRSQWLVSGIAITLLGTAFASVSGFVETARDSILEAGGANASRLRLIRLSRLQGTLALTLLATFAVLVVFGEGLTAGFAALACLLVGFALALPSFLSWIIQRASRFASGPLAEWFLADARLLLPGLSVALMALMMAGSANVGVSTMVGSFRTSFVDWLDKRLAAEIYLSARSEEEATAIEKWLTPKVDAVLPVMSERVRLSGAPGDIFTVADHATYRREWLLKASSDDAWDRVFAGEGVLINEQLSFRSDLSVGDTLMIEGNHSLPIVGIYPDYGNPMVEARIGIGLFEKWYPDTPRRRFVVRVDPNQSEEVIRNMQEVFALPDSNVANQAQVKQLSKQIFERNFVVTAGLNVLTLGVAVFALLTSLVIISNYRLPQLAPLWAMGVTRAQLARFELMRALLLALLTGVLAIPVGLLLGWVLLSVINVEAFGWQLPFRLNARDCFLLIVYSVLAAMIAAGYPVLRLAKVSPSALLKQARDAT